MPFSHFIFCRPLLLLPPIPPSIRVFSSESTLRMRWSKYWSFSFSIIPPKEHPGLISFRMDWLDLLAVLRDSQESSPTPQCKSINSSALSFLHNPTLTSMNCSMPGLPVHHQLPEFTQAHVHRVSDAIQPSHPLSSPFLPAPNPSQNESLYQ